MLPVETKRQRVNMISAVSSQGKVRFMRYQDTMNQQRLIRFMERLIRDSKQKVFLILDNLNVHHGKLAASWLKNRKDKAEITASSVSRIQIFPSSNAFLSLDTEVIPALPEGQVY